MEKHSVSFYKSLMQFSSYKQTERGSNLQAAFWRPQLGTPVPQDPIQCTHHPTELGSSSETTLSVWEQHRQVSKNNTSTLERKGQRPPVGQEHTKMTEETPCKEQARRLVCSVPTCCRNSSFPLSHPSVPPGMHPATSPSSHLDVGPGDSMCLAATKAH